MLRKLAVFRKNAVYTAWAASLGLVVCSCSSESDSSLPIPSTPDGGADVAVDVVIDTASAPDTAPDQDTGSPDTSVPDVAPPLDAGEDVPPCLDCWRSVLYPPDWQPGFQDAEGRFLHDFSYAGYRNGEAPLPATLPGPVFDVTDYGADTVGSSDATVAIQQAIDAATAASGGVVHFPPGIYRCDGRLQVLGSRVVLRGSGSASTAIYFTANSASNNQSNITFRGNIQQGPDLLLSSDGDNLSQSVLVNDASSLQVGDDIGLGWLISDAFVAEHGMAGTWQAFNGLWKPFFRRQVTAIDASTSPHRVSLDVPLRYPAKVRDQASLRHESGYLEECGVESLAISNAIGWGDAWTNTRVHAISMESVKDCWIRDVRSFDSPYDAGDHHLQSGGVYVLSSKRVTIADCRLERAQNRGGGGNGYLYEVSKSSEVLVRDSVGILGRHNFIQNWDFGTSGCVFLRCESSEGRSFAAEWDPIGLPGLSEYHHSLAMANLVDGCGLRDGWFGGNRGTESSGAGHTVTQSVYWNIAGGGQLISAQYGWGYVIGPGDMNLMLSLIGFEGTEPEDWLEVSPTGGPLEPTSLYEDQLARRLNPGP